MRKEIQSAPVKSVLILSYGPVPTPEYQKIEGGGMRCWGLAQGLTAHGNKVTVGINESFPQTIDNHQGINLVNWKLDDTFAQFINTFDTVILSYCMGDPSVFVADKLSSHVTLVLDCYVPIYIEVSARDSDDKVTELNAYYQDAERFNHVLRRGDYFLCANEPQKHMYAGILGSLGVINPYSYRTERLLVVPFGIEEEPLGKLAKKDNPYIELGVKEDDFVLLWFGGLYPWFDFTPLIEAVKELSTIKNFKFVLIGGKNPFNTNPDFTKQYDFVHGEFKKHGLVDKNVHFVDWVDFNTRLNWYQGADIVISLNQDGEENIYSWRTRVMDYVWGMLPMLTNGGDPLSDYLLQKGAALKIDKNSKNIVGVVKSLILSSESMPAVTDNLSKIREEFYWSNVTKIVHAKITQSNNLPYLEQQHFNEKNGIAKPTAGTVSFDEPAQSKLSKVRRLAGKARQKGIKRSAKFALDIAKSQVKDKQRKISKKNSKKVVLLSHPINNTGAPLVLLDLADDFAAKFGASKVHIVAPGIEKHLLTPLINKGFAIHKMAMGIGGRIIQANLGIERDDFVLMNTVALYPNYRQYVYWMLEKDKLASATWFIHEDQPAIRFTDKGELLRVKDLIKSGKLKIVVPSTQTAAEYNEFFETDHIKPVNLRVQIPDKLAQQKTKADFDTIRFVISGTPSDGRKGQLLFLAALQLFEAKHKGKNSKKYRGYTLDLISIEDDYISQQIKAVGKAMLGDKLHIHPQVPRLKALEITSECNVTVCVSLNETFALFVAEGMQMGHAILRNRSSGWQEQMQDGKNGYLVDGLNLDELADRIADVLSLDSDKLVSMSKKSQEIGSGFDKSNYYDQLII